MAAWEGKKYKYEKSENFDEYLKALGEFYLILNNSNSDGDSE